MTLAAPALLPDDPPRQDAFASHPWVTGAPSVRFYAGAPIALPPFGSRVAPDIGLHVGPRAAPHDGPRGAPDVPDAPDAPPSARGVRVGALCVLDTVPRTLT